MTRVHCTEAESPSAGVKCIASVAKCKRKLSDSAWNRHGQRHGGGTHFYRRRPPRRRQLGYQPLSLWFCFDL